MSLAAKLLLVLGGLAVAATILVLGYLAGRRRGAAGAKPSAGAGPAPAPPVGPPGLDVPIPPPPKVPEVPKAGPGGAAAAAGALGGLRALTPRLALRRAFARTMRLLRGHVVGRDFRYQIPWVMGVGEAEAGRTTLFANAGLSQPFGRPAEEGLGIHPGCTFWCFDRGLVLDVAGDLILRADGRTSDDRRWHALLRLLVRHRPRRPIDSVIVSIPSTDLFGPAAAGEAGLLRAREKGALLYQKLWHALRATGVCFPVYVVVTKCDLVRGFRDFCTALPRRFHDQAFGWSSPYSVETTYMPEMVDRAFDRLAAELQERELELFAEGRVEADEDELFLFPGEFERMRGPLRAYLGQLFQPSVYHDSFFLRGIYFSGDARPTGAGRPAWAAAEGEGGEPVLSLGPEPEPPACQPAFARHLLERKVFPEAGLGRPMSRALAARNRASVAAQVLLGVAIVGGGTGLGFGYAKLARARSTMGPVLAAIKTDLGEVHAAAAQQVGRTKAELEDDAANFAKGMAKVRRDRLTSAFVPTSWFSPLHGKLHQINELAYDGVLVKSIVHELRLRINDYLDPARPARPPERPAPGGAALDQLDEFLALRQFVLGLKEIGDNLAAYNSLRSGKDLAALARLAKFLVDLDLSPEAVAEAVFYDARDRDRSRDEPSRAWQPINAEAKRPAATAKLRRLTDPFFARAFEGNELRAHLRELAGAIERIEVRGPATVNDLATLAEAAEAIGQAEALLARPEFAWIVKPKFDPGPAYQEVLAIVEASPFLGRAVRADLEKAAEAGLQRLRAELAALATRLTGPLLEGKEADFALRLSPAVLAVKAAAATLANLKLAGVPDRAALRARLARGTRLVWETKPLEEAVALSEQYYQTVRKDLASLPETLAAAVRPRALRALEANLVDLIAQAGRVQPLSRPGAVALPEADLRAEAAGLGRATDLLLQLHDTVQQLGFIEASRDLGELLRGQAFRLLESVDRLLDEDALYAVADPSFAWWDGAGPVSLRAFEAGDSKELARLLELQRERTSVLARQFAAPAIAVLTARPARRTAAQDRLLARWQRILAELELYDGKKPNNALAVLEKFIQTDIDEITPKTVFQKVSPRDLAETTADFFLARRNSLRAAVYRRAQALARAAAQNEYAEIEQLFNRRLAGKFPFAEPADEGLLEADPDAIREFFQAYDRVAKTVREVVRRTARPGLARDQAVRFLEQVDDARAFLGAVVDGAGKGQPPAADLEVEFRVNEAKEVGANQIIEWTFEVGEQRLRHRDPKRAARWRFGDPVRFSARWAKDAREAPVAERAPGRARGQVEDRTVTFASRNRWSLVSFLVQHAVAPGDVDGARDPHPHTLKFVVPTRRVGDREPAAAAPGGEAKLFIRVGLRPVDKKDALVLPAFPTRAPALNGGAGG
jgi:type VI secretion system protein ImpL